MKLKPFAIVTVLAVAAGLAVDQARPAAPATTALHTTARSVAVRIQPGVTLAQEAAAERCRERRRQLLAEPGLPGAPALEQQRARVLGQAKAEPVLFVRTPEPAAEPARAVSYRKQLERQQFPWSVVQWLVPRFVYKPEDGRAALLREGYLYAESPELAYALVDHVGARHLFDAPRIWVQRGTRTMWAERRADRDYVYVDGPYQGKKVRLILFDRVGTGQPPPPLHRDLRGLRYQLHFDRMRVEHITEHTLVAQLGYAGRWVPSVLRSVGARLELECEATGSEMASWLERHRAARARQLRGVQALRSAMLEQIDERIPFDEPIEEYGQQDGVLRAKWRSAYLAGRTSYRFNGDRYYVFAPDGRPRVPQVCVDFLVDTLERASGTWWQRQGLPPARVMGKLDLGALDDPTLRRVPRFLELAEGDSRRFEVYHVPPSERVQMQYKPRFYAYLAEHAELYQPGDIVIIRGYTNFEKPWQKKVMHYHSFFVYESDPLTGMPIALVGNPGTPAIRTWEFEGLRTPKRSIWHRVRPRADWLESIVVPRAAPPRDPTPLDYGPA